MDYSRIQRFCYVSGIPNRFICINREGQESVMEWSEGDDTLPDPVVDKQSVSVDWIVFRNRAFAVKARDNALGIIEPPLVVTWFEEQAEAYCSLSLDGDRLTFTVPVTEPSSVVTGCNSIMDTAEAFLVIHHKFVGLDDIKRAYQSYTQGGSGTVTIAGRSAIRGAQDTPTRRNTNNLFEL